MKVCASLVNWHRWDQTSACLRSLVNEVRYPGLEIVVVDNSAAEQPLGALVAAEFPDVVLISRSENRGYAAGHRCAVEHAARIGADLVWLLNTDLVPRPDSLSHLVEALRRHGPGLYGSVPLVAASDETDPDLRRVDLAEKFVRIPYRERVLTGAGLRTRGELFPDGRDVLDVSALAGCSFIVPLSVIREHGFIDESFFLYSEEIDYCFRLRRRGVSVRLVRASLVEHDTGGTTRRNRAVSSVAEYYRTRNQILRVRRHQGTADLLRVLLKDVGILSIRAWNGLWRTGGPSLFPARMVLRGVLDGLRGRTGKTWSPDRYRRASTQGAAARGRASGACR